MLLEAQALEKVYGSHIALANMSFTLGAGEVLGYIGANGTGKSTTVRMLVGLSRPTNGRVLADGADIQNNLIGYKARFGYVPEEAHVYPYLSGMEYLELNAGLRAIGDDVAAWKIGRLLECFGLTDYRFSPLSQYSKGMRQKILIMAALLHDPELLILDEPFSGLDFFAAAVLTSTLKELRRLGRAILLCSHERNIIDTLCTKVVLLGAAPGECEVFECTPREREQVDAEGLLPALPVERAGQVALKIVETIGAR
jgi:ABC-2 type transport system ATP-binding protein